MSTHPQAASISSDAPAVSTATASFPPAEYSYRSGTVASFNQPGVLVSDYTFALPSPSYFLDHSPSESEPQLDASLAPSITSKTGSSVYSRTSAFTSHLSRQLVRGIGGQRDFEQARSVRGPNSPPGSPRRSANPHRYPKPYLRLGSTSRVVRRRTKRALMAVLKHVLVVVVIAPASFMLKTTTSTIFVTKTRVQRPRGATEELELVAGPQIARIRQQPHSPLLQAFFAPSLSLASISYPLTPPIASLTPAQQEELIEAKRMFSQEKALQILGEEALDDALRSAEGFGLKWLESVERERGHKILDCIPSSEL
ncbi:hypothetical protein V5O48_017863 [Marasmius crinis-equi]|uniref:Uncharacterized protein n=1 Tax=Marasmius crinis-equi TaxID=585013 RepID=A0ABR3EMY8_9AGAR